MQSALRLPPGLGNREFGWQFGTVLSVVSLIGLWQGFWQWLVLTLAFLAMFHFLMAWLAPSVLTQINRAWMALGFLLGKVVGPLVLALMFVVFFVPVAALMRLWGRDELLLRDRSGDSFWIERPEPVISTKSFHNQY